jgi:hypothetical protein
LRLCFHRALPDQAVIKHVVIQRVNERWYVCLMLEMPDAVPAPVPTSPPVRPLGVDVGLHSWLVFRPARPSKTHAGCGKVWFSCASCNGKRPAR